MKYRILLIPLIVLASFATIWAGMGVGNLLYEMDAGLVESIDTNTFKSAMNASFPIINTIYNNGNISVSFSGEIKNLIKGIFNFDIDTPYSILNVQSPLFLSYYNNVYKSRLLADESGDKNNGNNLTDKNNSTQQSGSGIPGIDAGNTQDNSAGNNAGNSSTNGSNAGIGTVSAPQFASSITYEAEGEEQKQNSSIVSHDKIVIQNYSKFKIDIEELLNEPLKIKFDKKGPQVLIYHTHTTESYVINPKDQGKKGIPSYNTDPRYSVVRVGEELARNLKKYGIAVLHNGTVHDANRNAAYGAAIKTVEKYVKSYPSIKAYLDIHRDGLDSSQPKLDADKKINGKTAAQVMFVVGTNETLPHPQWKENLKLALKLQKYLNDKYPGFARPIWISSNRYNQHVSDGAILIEIGGDGNLLSECLESTKYVAEALDAVVNKK